MVNAVVEFSVLEEGIALIKMQDKAHKNTFSPALVEGLTLAFAKVANDACYKAVILTGYDNYFCSGGTKDELIALQESRMIFTDIDIYRLALDCKVPVISAMQGHGIGGGLVTGLFSDFILMSKESIYTFNFMNYGFTPGMGATYIVPKKMGFSLAQEMLMSGNTYRGEQLQQRGIPFGVYPRNQVIEQAVELARSLAEKPQHSLITLKDHLVSDIRAELPGFIEKEKSMHAATFHHPLVREKIEQLF